MIVHSFWHGGPLSPLEQACYRSWTRHGYRHWLWSYSPIPGTPASSTVCDAAAILPPSRVFRYRTGTYGVGSVSGFANFFRYRLLQLHGGIWADSDMYCLRRLPEQEYLFVAEADKVATCLFRVPPQSPAMTQCWRRCDRLDVRRLRWAESGPFLLTRVVRRLKLDAAVRPQAEFLPVLWTEAARFTQAPPLDLSRCYAVHFWHQQLCEQGIDKAGRYPGSTYDQLVHDATDPVP